LGLLSGVFWWLAPLYHLYMYKRSPLSFIVSSELMFCNIKKGFNNIYLRLLAALLIAYTQKYIAIAIPTPNKNAPIHSA